LWLDNFPLTPNGKVDRRALPSLDLTVGEEYIAPKNDLQQELVSIWSEVLGIAADKISITSDFFSLGGHSLSAITLSNKINKAFSVELPLREFFVHRTISSLSNYISSSDHVVFESIPKAESNEFYPLSSAQRRMYFLYEFDKGATSYNMPGFYKISGDYDASKLSSVFGTLVSRHESLRMVFDVVGDVPVQRVLAADGFELEYYSCGSEDVSLFLSDFVRPFDLSTDFPIRVGILDVSGEFSILMIDMHHIINDGVSQEILMREFWSLYQGLALPALRIQYTDYAVWQQSASHQDMVSSHKSYWLARYSEEVKVLDLPTDHVRSMHRSHAGAVHSFSFSTSDSDKLRSLASSSGVTMYTLFLAMYNILLSKLSNQSDIVVGTPTAGRHHADLEDVVGMFVNTLALRNEVAGELKISDFLSAIQDSTLSAFDHQLYQYEELVDALDLPRDVGRNPLFDVFYSYHQDLDSTVFEGSDLMLEPYDVSHTISKFDLSLNVLDSDQIGLSFVYCKDVFEPSTIARFSDYLLAIVDDVLSDQDQYLKDIDILSSAERDRLLFDFNDTFSDYDLSHTVLDMFKSQVAMRSEAKALILGDRYMSYQDLDDRSDLWSHALISQGVKPGAIVGLIMDRSLEMITSILAVMKAGAAYVPINPDQPVSRTLHMLSDCESDLCITNIDDLSEEITSSYRCLGYEILDSFELAGVIEDLPYVRPDSLAYVIYTSGSTGQPKG
ncbi:condensation domain-containing protein, partial [Aquimarina sp. D1M17]|uniref:condensation domain-containing protein n=1 Tax=Aquimarina acroporae TaxID=2937283 RepID=UPI0020BDA9F9